MVRKRIHFVSAPFVHGLPVEQDFPFARFRLRVGAVEGEGGGGQRSKNEREYQAGLNAHNLTSFESCIGCHAGRSSVRTSFDGRRIQPLSKLRATGLAVPSPVGRERVRGRDVLFEIRLLSGTCFCTNPHSGSPGEGILSPSRIYCQMASICFSASPL